MKNKLLIFIISIFLISCVSAIDLTAGEPYSFDLGEIYSHYKITENSTKVNLNISQLGTITTIILDKYMKDGDFTITFYNEKNEVIRIPSSGGSSGGGGGGYTLNCSEWSECNQSGIQKQICNSNSEEIIKTRSCDYIEINKTEENLTREESSGTLVESPEKNERGFLSFTGNVIQTAGDTISKPTIGIVLLVLVIGGIIFMFIKRKNSSKSVSQ